MMTRRNMLMATIGLLTLPRISAPTAVSSAVILRITPAEAQALANVICYVGGNPYLTDRGHIDTVRELLQEQGYSHQWGNVIEHTIMNEDGSKRWHYNTITLRSYSEYNHVRPAGPYNPWQHSPDLRYLRRQRDGVKL